MTTPDATREPAPAPAGMLEEEVQRTHAAGFIAAVKSRLPVWQGFRPQPDAEEIVPRADLLALVAVAEEADALRARVAELEAGLREALIHVRPEVSEVVKEYSDLDGEQADVREENQRIRDKHARLAALLANPEATQ